MRRPTLASMALLILASHPALGDTVTWVSPSGAFTGLGSVFDRQTPGGNDLTKGPATVTISYNTTGPLDLSIGVSIIGIDPLTGAPSFFSRTMIDPNGSITWRPDYLSFTANGPFGGEAVEQMSVEFSPGIPRPPGETVPPSLDGLPTYGANGSGGTIGHGWQVIFGAVPEPSSVVLIAQVGVAAGLAVMAARWARRKAAQ